MKNTILTVVAVVTLSFAFANRTVELSSLDNLSRVDEKSELGIVLTGVNEHALKYLPVAATLRAEDVIAGLAAPSSTTVASR